MPSAIDDKTAYGNALEMVHRLAVVPALNDDQTRYLDNALHAARQLPDDAGPAN